MGDEKETASCLEIERQFLPNSDQMHIFLETVIQALDIMLLNCAC